MSPITTGPLRERPTTMAPPQAPAQIPDSARVGGLDHPPAAVRRRLAVPRRAGFWLLAFVFAAAMLGTTLPTPLYVIYQAQWHFSAAIVTVIFAVYAAGVLAALLLAGRSSDQAGRKPVLAAALGASALRRPVLRFAGLGIPERGRGEFIAAAAAAFSAFSLLGLFSALAPTFLGVMHEHNHATAGAVVFLLFAVGTITQLLTSRFPSRPVVMAGLGLLLAALALIVAALAQAGVALFLAGTVVAGIAVGAVFLGSLATANRLAPPGRRGQAISAYFVACYCGLVIPVVGVRVAAGFIGDFPAVLALAILLTALCVFALASMARTLAPRRAVTSR